VKTAPGAEACPACGAAPRARAKFCGSCGQALAQGARRAPDQTSTRRDMGAVALIYLGVLALLIGLGTLLPVALTPWAELGHEAALCAGFVALGCLAAWRLGPGALRSSLGGPARAGDLGLAAVLGAGVLAFNLAWLTWLNVALGEGEWGFEFSVPQLLLVVLLGGTVLPALFEEWLSRGVLWTALERLTDVRTTIFLTAALFAMFHGLNGGEGLELPSRFLLGLAAGWLRARSGSLWPGIVLHLVNNLLASFLVG
jgi:membrane protease YdiL (CAAX protease family)